MSKPDPMLDLAPQAAKFEAPEGAGVRFPAGPEPALGWGPFGLLDVFVEVPPLGRVVDFWWREMVREAL